MLIHLHIAKTGGTSLNSMIKHAFPKEEVLELTHPTPGAMQQAPLESLTLGKASYITGHVPLRIQKLFPYTRFVTTVRDPIDRVNSFFHFQAEDDGRYMKRGKPLTFEEYVLDGVDVQLHNYQTRVLCGLPDVEFLGREQSPAGTFLSVDHLRQAKRNIDSFFLAAPMERLAELGLILRRAYGWPMRKIQSEHMNASEKPSILPHLYRRLKNYNLLDLELHEWIMEHFTAAPLYDRILYGVTNTALRTAGSIVPWHLRKRIAKVVLGWS